MSAAAKRIMPLLDRVLIQKIKPTERTASGLFLPENTRETQNEGTVIAVGPGSMTKDGTIIPMALSVGDRVIVPEYGGNTVKLGEEEYQLYKSAEILAKVHAS